MCLSRSAMLSGIKDVFNFVCKLPQYTREIKEKIQELEDKVQDMIDELQNTVQEKISDAKNTIEETKNTVTEKVTEVKTYVVDLAPLIISGVVLIVFIFVEVKVCIWRKRKVEDAEDAIVREFNHRLLKLASRSSPRAVSKLSDVDLEQVLREAKEEIMFEEKLRKAMIQAEYSNNEEMNQFYTPSEEA